ncbi:MAG TPA: acetamidase, partial [Actinomycetes bacterium]|nr:acetamidase [Actinomycetes bacterium]
DDAVRMAVDGMHESLCRRGLDPVEAYMLLSIAGHVGVNQVVNAPHVGARITLAKAVLAPH